MIKSFSSLLMAPAFFGWEKPKNPSNCLRSPQVMSEIDFGKPSGTLQSSDSDAPGLTSLKQPAKYPVLMTDESEGGGEALVVGEGLGVDVGVFPLAVAKVRVSLKFLVVLTPYASTVVSFGLQVPELAILPWPNPSVKLNETEVVA